ncbi:DNA-binding transcriptional regulator, LysR family [Lentzea fradiae]|uniref:DNA-binding transcriptional regulator, LysR family n=1 Tax=Lentzea fradiae TaxID=200378 RepID=A0A1G7NJD2_9PSEU|nr:LysR family transcriptional regulator [Lentzea fradiae]SDF74051.1 DNA-binding transcriptional regulator, LysR family [Lentzea fradiae]
MELRTLRYFVTVAEELHFGRAAERLRIVQSAVSQQIARFERELGVRLFDRTSRSVRLTPAGERVLVAARDTLSAAARVRVVAGAQAAAVRIGVATCVTPRLDRALTLLSEGDRAVEPELVSLPVGARVDAVRAGELDVALVRGAFANQAVTAVRAWSEPLHVVVPKTHPAADAEAVRFGDLDPDELRLPARESDPPLFDAILAALPAAPRRPPAGDLLSVLFEVGTAPRGWTLLPAEQLGSSSPRLRQLPLDPPVSVDGHVVTSRATPDTCVASYVAAFGNQC